MLSDFMTLDAVAGTCAYTCAETEFYNMDTSACEGEFYNLQLVIRRFAMANVLLQLISVLTVWMQVTD